jgi:alpha-ketoglutarate-dependent 2,4-dichlorophenoxyacetate dioxygenase
MALTVKPADPKHPDFIGVISDIDLRQADSAMRSDIEAAMDKYAVLVFRNQTLTDDEQVSFSSLFGELETSRNSMHPEHKPRFDDRLSDISNLTHDGKIVPTDDRRWMRSLGNRLWHSDSSYKATPAKYSMLSARVLPSWGGETEFADLRAAYDALSDRMKARVKDMEALHSEAFSRAKIGFTNYAPNEVALNKPVPQALVRTHPGSNRKTLFLASHAGKIVGMTVPEGRMLLHDLIEHATQREFVYRHTWTVGDFVIWDNRCLMHRAREFDASEIRDMRRSTVGDIAPTLEQKKMQETAALL